jgi:hypothetical protein
LHETENLPNPFTETLFVQTPNLDKNIEIKTDKPGNGSFYLCALTNGRVSSPRLIEYSVCGDEQVTLKDPESKIDFEIDQKDQGEELVPSS